MVKVYAIDGVTPVVHPSAFVHPTAVLIGDIIIGPNCYVGPCASIRADFGRFLMGPGSNFQDNCTAHTFSGGEVIIGENCNIGHGAVLHGPKINDRVLIGMNAVVMDGVQINSDVLVAALTFVPAAMKVPSGTIIAGTPAKVLRQLNTREKEWIAEGNNDYLALIHRSRESIEEKEALTEIASEEPRLQYHGAKPLYASR